jgi:hypothetical protein
MSGRRRHDLVLEGRWSGGLPDISLVFIGSKFDQVGSAAFS